MQENSGIVSLHKPSISNIVQVEVAIPRSCNLLPCFIFLNALPHVCQGRGFIYLNGSQTVRVSCDFLSSSIQEHLHSSHMCVSLYICTSVCLHVIYILYIVHLSESENWCAGDWREDMTKSRNTEVNVPSWFLFWDQLTIQHLPQHHQGRARSDRFLEFALGWVQATVRARTTSSMSDDGWKHFLAPGPTPSLYLQSCQVEFGRWFISVKFQSPQLLASHFGKSYNYISVESLAKRFLSNLDILFLKRP